MGLGNIVNKAKRKIDERGGSAAFKQDAQQLKDIAKGKGTLSEKAKRAQQAVKEPGHGAGQGGPASGASTPQGAPAAPGAGSSAPDAGPTGVGHTGATPGAAGSAGPGPTATDLPSSEEQSDTEPGRSQSSGPQSPG